MCRQHTSTPGARVREGSAGPARPPVRAEHATQKLPIYGRERVAHVWLVDALLKTLEVLRLDGDGYRIVGAWCGDTVVRCEPFESLALNLADLWSA